MAELRQRLQDPAGAAAEFEDGGPLRHRGVHDLRLPERGKQRVKLDGAAVVGDLTGTGASSVAHEESTAPVRARIPESPPSAPVPVPVHPERTGPTPELTKVPQQAVVPGPFGIWLDAVGVEQQPLPARAVVPPSAPGRDRQIR